MAFNIYDHQDSGAVGRLELRRTALNRSTLPALLKQCLVTGYKDEPPAGWSVVDESADGSSIVLRPGTTEVPMSDYTVAYEIGHYTENNHLFLTITRVKTPAASNAINVIERSPTACCLLQYGQPTANGAVYPWIIVADSSTCIVFYEMADSPTGRFKMLYFGEVDPLSPTANQFVDTIPYLPKGPVYQDTNRLLVTTYPYEHSNYQYVGGRFWTPAGTLYPFINSHYSTNITNHPAVATTDDLFKIAGWNVPDLTAFTSSGNSPAIVHPIYLVEPAAAMYSGPANDMSSFLVTNLRYALRGVYSVSVPLNRIQNRSVVRGAAAPFNQPYVVLKVNVTRNVSDSYASYLYGVTPAGETAVVGVDLD